jgi:hypothetical protein
MRISRLLASGKSLTQKLLKRLRTAKATARQRSWLFAGPEKTSELIVQ